MTQKEIESRIEELELELSVLRSGNTQSGLQTENSLPDSSILTPSEDSSAPLNETHESLSNHYDASFGHVAFINAETLKYEFVNVLYEKLFGIPRDKIIGRHMRDVIGESNYQYGLRFMNEAKAGKSVSYDSVFNLGGKERWLKVNFSPVIDASGHVLSIAVLTQDITERKISERKLNESEENLHKIIATTSEGYWLMNEKGHFMDVNPAFCELIGYTKDELLNMSIPDLEAIESKVETEQHIQKVGKIGTERFDTVMRHKNGSLINVEINVSKFGMTGKQFFVFVHDISERKKAEKEIVRQNDALSKLNHFALELSKLSFEDNLEELIAKKVKELSGAEVSIFSEYDHENHITSIKCIELESGMLKKVVKLLGKKVQNIHSPISDNIYREMSRDIVGSRKTLHEVSFGAVSKPVGASVQALLNIDRFIGLAYLTDGRLYGTSVLGMRKNQPDPPKKILENFVHLAATSLQRKKIEKQLKIKIEELINTNKKLEQYAHANEELEQFAFIASHNLQQPLRTVSNYVQIFEEDYSDRFDDKAYNYLRTVKDSVSRMMLLLNSLLDFSRIGRNIDLKKINCKQLISDVIADIETLIVSTDTTITISAMPELHVYESEFSQLIQNLIVNAIKFQKPGNKPKITISSIKINSGWQFSLSDNGIGIASKYFERIFDIFQRLHNDSEFQGSGIGLAFCKKIVQLHKGKIWIESAEGQGTTVHFTIADLEE